MVEAISPAHNMYLLIPTCTSYMPHDHGLYLLLSRELLDNCKPVEGVDIRVPVLYNAIYNRANQG